MRLSFGVFLALSVIYVACATTESTRYGAFVPGPTPAQQAVNNSLWTAAPTLVQLQDLSSGKLETLAGGSWEDTMMLEAQALVPTLTNFDTARFGIYTHYYDNSSLGPNVVDANQIGGAYQVVNGWANLTATIQTNPTASAGWAVAFRATLQQSGGAGGSVTEMGLRDPVTNKIYGFMAYSGIDATHLIQVSGTTNYVTSLVIDGNEHDYLLTWDGTNFKLTVDGMLIHSMAAGTSAPTAASSVAIYCSGQGTYSPYLRRFGFGW